MATVDPLDLPRVDVLCAGFACTDLSCAGQQASRDDLHAGSRTGPTYRGVVRFVAAIRPEIVVLENVPAVLRHRPTIEADMPEYGWTWVRCGAWDAGAPHLRRRVFTVGVRGGREGGIVDAPTTGRWTSDADRIWPTATSRDYRSAGGLAHTHGGVTLNDEAAQARTWATVVGRDYKCGDLPTRVGTEALSQQAAIGRRLSADWTETLMGFPVGWTLPTGPRQECAPAPRWPRGRYPATWDRSILWPGYAWEPPRTLPDGPPCPGRPARLKALGNSVVPAQGALAIRTALEPHGSRQLPILEAP